MSAAPPEKLVQDMTENEFIDHCLSDMMGGWVPVTRYLKMFPEETDDMIYGRVRRGIWKRREHYSAPQGGAGWINLPAIRRWLEESQQTRKKD